MQLLNLKTDKVPTADAEHPAIEVLAVWQAAEGPGIGGIPTRGFAGQLFFFTQDRAAPVAVDGKARIYVFDDHGSAEQQTRPLRQFDFDRQSWTAHLQSSKLGPTYGVFIPYPRNDYHQAICSLRIRFTPTTKGRPLFSTSSTIVLPGPPLKPEAEMAHASPLDSLAKKLQSQSLKAAWKPALVDTDARPFAMNPQIAGAQTPEMASGDRPTVALLPAPNPVVAPEDPSNLQAGSSLAAYASSQAGRGAMFGAIQFSRRLVQRIWARRKRMAPRTIRPALPLRQRPGAFPRLAGSSCRRYPPIPIGHRTPKAWEIRRHNDCLTRGTGHPPRGRLIPSPIDRNLDVAVGNGEGTS
jgi:hypothetical protein